MKQISSFADLLTRLAHVPKHEIDEQEEKEKRKFKARKTHKAYAKAGQIATQTHPERGDDHE